MFGQLWVALGVADADGAAAVLADPVLVAVVPDVEDEVVDDVVDADVDEWLVAALATAMLPPKPTPSAPAPTAVPMMIFPTLDLTCPPPRGWVCWSWTQDTHAGCGGTAATLCPAYEIRFSVRAE
jgi:hypothetical protein